jgi:hypothetical protein
MTPEELTGAARNLADGLGIPVYIREGQIYQHGPGVEFLPRRGSGSTAPGAPHLCEDTVPRGPRPTVPIEPTVIASTTFMGYRRTAYDPKAPEAMRFVLQNP